jgi:hypothetical protein
VAAVADPAIFKKSLRSYPLIFTSPELPAIPRSSQYTNASAALPQLDAFHRY